MGIDALMPVALGHYAVAAIFVLFFLSHLYLAPIAWFEKRRLRRACCCTAT
jgi:hypothetical protein